MQKYGCGNDRETDFRVNMDVFVVISKLKILQYGCNTVMRLARIITKMLFPSDL